ncbi:MAG: hypothetical protein V1851_00040 [Patescibacteria group bacterium]
MSLSLCCKSGYPIFQKEFVRTLINKGFAVSVKKERQYSCGVCWEVLMKTPALNECFCFEISFSQEATEIKNQDFVPQRFLKVIESSFVTA